MKKTILKLENFQGLDRNAITDENPSLSGDMLNFKINEKYELVKRPGLVPEIIPDAQVRAMWCGTINTAECFAYVSGGQLYVKNQENGSTSVYGPFADGNTTIFDFDGMLYLMNGQEYYRFDGSSFQVVEGYIPVVSVSTAPGGAGTAYEGINLLTPKRRQLFSSTFEDRIFRLAESNISSVEYVKVNGSETNQYISYPTEGYIEFFTPPPAGINNVEVCYSTGICSREKICACMYSTLFGSNADTRVFLWGNPVLPAYRFHSELAGGAPSAEYFPENNFTVIGSSRITDIVQQYDRQLIFTPGSAYYSYCDIRSDSLGNVFSSFPVYSLNQSKGNMLSGTGCVIDGKPVTLCSDGLNIWESTNVENEKNAVCFSLPVNDIITKITLPGNLNGVCLFDHQSENELYLAFEEMLYIYNYRLGAWYVYDGVNAVCFCDCFGSLHIAGTDNRIYRFDEEEIGHNAFWRSPCLMFGSIYEKKDIIEIAVNTVADEAAGYIVGWTDETRSAALSGCYSAESAGQEGIFSRRYRIPLKRVVGAEITITAPPGKKLHLLNMAVTIIRKGGMTYGV